MSFKNNIKYNLKNKKTEKTTENIEDDEYNYDKFDNSKEFDEKIEEANKSKSKSKRNHTNSNQDEDVGDILNDKELLELNNNIEKNVSTNSKIKTTSNNKITSEKNDSKKKEIIQNNSNTMEYINNIINEKFVNLEKRILEKLENSNKSYKDEIKDVLNLEILNMKKSFNGDYKSTKKQEISMNDLKPNKYKKSCKIVVFIR